MDLPKKDFFIILIILVALIAMCFLYVYYDQKTTAIEEQILKETKR